MLADLSFNALTHDIIGAAIEVHRALGPGLLESSYPAYRVDLIVENAVVVELKAVDRLISVHDAQVLTYMRLTSCPAGLLINFNVPKLVDGVKRLILPSR